MEELNSLNLNKYESKAYKAILEEGTSSAYEISKISKVPHGKIYPTLSSLISKGLIIEIDGRPKMYQLVEPKIVFEREMKRKEAELKNLQNSFETVSKLFESSKLKKQDSFETVKIINGYKDYLILSAKLHGECEKEWLTISRVPVYKQHLDSYLDCIKRGVNVKVIATKTLKNEKNIEVWKESGINVRTYRNLPTRFSVIDGKKVVIRFSEGNSYIAILINNVSLAEGMRKHFMETWKKAEK